MESNIYTFKENITLSHMAKCTKKIKYNINENGCWICISHIQDKDGYPKICRNKKHLRMSRYIYEQINGVIPENNVIRHTCDNPNCINPNHLIVGTVQDNTNDRTNRKRGAIGEKNGGGNKLTEEQVILILKDVRQYRDIAKDYGIHYSMVGYIKNGKSWKHVEIGSTDGK